MIRIGIDPGKNGYICFMYENNIKYSGIPLINKEVDLQKLNNEFLLWDTVDYDVHCVIEDVHALYGSSAKSTFNFGWIAGVLEALLVANEIPYTKVQPKDWQKEMWQGIPKITKQGKNSTDTKAMSLLAAKRLFPNEDLRATERCTKPHDGLVDSLLLAEYCRRHF